MVKLIAFQPHHKLGFIHWNKNQDELARFAGHSFRYPLSLEQIGDFPAKVNATAFALESEDGLHLANGDFVVDHENKEIRLCRLIVHCDYRGQGYGRLLVEGICSKAKETQLNYRISLNVLDDNVAAIALYSKCGFHMSDQTFSFEVDGIVYRGHKMYLNEDKTASKPI